MSIFTEKSLARQAVNNAGEDIYTVPESTKGIITDIHVCNNSSSDCYVTIWIVPDGDSPTDEGVMMYQWSVPANDFVHWSGWMVLEDAGDKIHALAETSDQITIHVSGAEIT